MKDIKIMNMVELNNLISQIRTQIDILTNKRITQGIETLLERGVDVYYQGHDILEPFKHPYNTEDYIEMFGSGLIYVHDAVKLLND